MKLLNVFYRGHLKPILVGRLALRDRTVFFEYADEFLATKLELSPFKLPLKPGLHSCEDRTFNGIWGLFNDSLPDGFGRLLLDRKLMQMGINPKALNPLDRLAYVGDHGMGALSYEPDRGHFQPSLESNLDEIADYCAVFQQNGNEDFIDELLALNGSSAGARPKILIRLDNQEDWLIKFRSSTDPEDMALIEYAYHLMAAEAGLLVPTARLFESKKGCGYFGVKRFDRSGKTHSHMHTASGLLHADHRIPSLDYEILLKATTALTNDVREPEKFFRQAVFNVLSHNRDDHAKNFSFLMDSKGCWRLSPAYDLTFSSGPMGEHCTTVMGEGKNPHKKHLLQLAEVAQIKKAKAQDVIEEVYSAVLKWPLFAKSVGVRATSRNLIASLLGSAHSGSLK